MSNGSPPQKFQDLIYVQLTNEERISETISPESMGKAISALHRDGIVVLENAINAEHIDKLVSILTEEGKPQNKVETGIGIEPDGNTLLGPPTEPDLMFSDVWANGPATAVISGMMGPNPRINFANGNMSRNGSKTYRQPVHADILMNHAQFPWGILAVLYLADATLENGATEVWLGSHRDTTFADHRNCVPNAKKPTKETAGIKFDLLEQRRTLYPPILTTTKKGSIVLRDVRTWHAGLANPLPEPQIVLAFMHTPWWYQAPGKVVLPEATRELVEQWARRKENPVTINAHFVPAHLDHKLVKIEPNFVSKNKGYLSLLPDLPAGYVPTDDQ